MEVAAPHYRGCGRPIATEIAGKVIALKLRAAKIAVLQRHAMHLAALDLGKAEVTASKHGLIQPTIGQRQSGMGLRIGETTVFKQAVAQVRPREPAAQDAAAIEPSPLERHRSKRGICNPAIDEDSVRQVRLTPIEPAKGLVFYRRACGGEGVHGARLVGGGEVANPSSRPVCLLRC